jgi:hypothetical protein
MSFVSLDTCEGPACTRCGCRDTEILQARQRRSSSVSRPQASGWAVAKAGWPQDWAAMQQARCRYCGTVFNFVDLGPQAAAPAPIVIPPLAPLQLPPLQEAASAISIPQEIESKPREPGDAVCPKCGGQFHPYSTKGKTQYRRCKNEKCGHKGKTVKK